MSTANTDGSDSGARTGSLPTLSPDEVTMVLLTIDPAWWRRRIVVVPAMVAINVAVFLAWQLPAARELMLTHFLVSFDHIRSGLVWTLVTTVFSHSQLWHLVLNMAVLLSFGVVLERLWGARLLIAFYLAAGVTASISHCLVSWLILDNPRLAALGASGALSAVLAACAMLFPRHRILLMGVVPLPAIWAVVALVVLDTWGLIAQGRGGGLPIGHGAHLGGALFGVVLGLVWLRPKLRRRVGRAAVNVLAEGGEVEPATRREVERIGGVIAQRGPDALTAEDGALLARLARKVVKARGSAGNPSGRPL